MGRRLVLVALIGTDETLYDAELRVGLQNGVVVAVELGGDGLVTRFVDQRMEMGRPEGMAFERGQEIAHGPVRRYRVTGRLDTAEGEDTFLVAEELPAEVPLGLLGVLVLIEAGR